MKMYDVETMIDAYQDICKNSQEMILLTVENKAGLHFAFHKATIKMDFIEFASSTSGHKSKIKYENIRAISYSLEGIKPTLIFKVS